MHGACSLKLNYYYYCYYMTTIKLREKSFAGSTKYFFDKIV
jgi:hypothetical protein